MTELNGKAPGAPAAQTQSASEPFAVVGEAIRHLQRLDRAHADCITAVRLVHRWLNDIFAEANGLNVVSAADLLRLPEPPSRVKVDRRLRIFRIQDPTAPDEDERECYWVPFDRARTGEQIADWALHLAGKRWVNRDIIHDFIEKAFEVAGIERGCA